MKAVAFAGDSFFYWDDLLCNKTRVSPFQGGIRFIPDIPAI